jgi:hypothetical protein
MNGRIFCKIKEYGKTVNTYIYIYTHTYIYIYIYIYKIKLLSPKASNVIKHAVNVTAAFTTGHTTKLIQRSAQQLSSLLNEKQHVKASRNKMHFHLSRRQMRLYVMQEDSADLIVPPQEIYRTKYCSVARFQVLTATSMKITVFCDVAPCSLVEV